MGYIPAPKHLEFILIAAHLTILIWPGERLSGRRVLIVMQELHQICEYSKPFKNGIKQSEKR